jgi:hypothetical protein
MNTIAISQKMIAAMEHPCNNFLSEEEYLIARQKHDANHEAVKQWLTDHKTNAIPVEISNTMPFAEEINNNLRSKIETWEFIHDKPEKYFIYINEEKKIATTWTGDYLGLVYLGAEHYSNFGDKRQDITMWGVNGIKYYGTYYKSNGDYARIKAYKNQSI